MLDFDTPKLILWAIVALVVIPPKDLPKVMRTVGQWMAKARQMAGHFRSGVDEMVRQSELAELEAKWQAENQKIIAQTNSLTETSSSPSEASSSPASAPKAD